MSRLHKLFGKKEQDQITTSLVTILEDNKLDELQKASDYRMVRKKLLPVSVTSIIIGLIIIYLGRELIDMHFINSILVLIGILLLAQGIWFIFAPKPVGMIVQGITTFVIAMWNISISFLNITMAKTVGTEGGVPWLAGLGALQIGWALQSFRWYKRFAAYPKNKPSKDILRGIDAVVKAITKGKLKDQPDVVVFNELIGTRGPVWRGKLYHDSAIFVQGSEEDIVFAEKRDVTFEKQGKVIIGEPLEVSLIIADRKMNGTILPEYFERYETWKMKAQ